MNTPVSEIILLVQFNEMREDLRQQLENERICYRWTVLFNLHQTYMDTGTLNYHGYYGFWEIELFWDMR